MKTVFGYFPFILLLLFIAIYFFVLLFFFSFLFVNLLSCVYNLYIISRV